MSGMVVSSLNRTFQINVSHGMNMGALMQVKSSYLMQ